MRATFFFFFLELLVDGSEYIITTKSNDRRHMVFLTVDAGKAGYLKIRAEFWRMITFDSLRDEELKKTQKHPRGLAKVESGSTH